MGKRRRRRSLFSRTPKPVPVAAEGGVPILTAPAHYRPTARPATPAPPPEVEEAPPPPVPARPVPSPAIAASPLAGDVVAPKQSRIERRRQQRQRKRRRRFSAVGVLAVVAAIVAAVVVVGLATHHSKGKPKTAARTQTTLLVQIRNSDGTAAVSALLAHDPVTKRGVVLLVPARVVADLPGHGDAPFETASAVGSASLSQATLSDLVGVTVDGAIAFDARSFATLVDRLGGITVDVARDVSVKQRNGTRRVVVARGGGQHLNGGASVAYATFNPGGPAGELVQLTQFEDVLNGLLAKTTSASVVTSTLGVLGHGVQTTMPPARAGTLLAGLSTDASADAIDYQTLDVKLVDTGGAPIYTLDRPKVAAFVQQSLRTSIPAGLLSGGNSVLVKNGVGTPELGRSTRDLLVKSGFVYVDGHNVPGFPYRNHQSVVIVFSTSQSSIDRGNRVAKSLGLPTTDVRVSRLGQSVADVIVLLGQDYRR
ncbi:MAG: LCP family protein [Actinomycetes bacterium]